MDSYTKKIGNIESHHLMAFLSAIFDKGVAYSIVNNAKRVVATILYIPTYPSINNHLLVMKFITGIFNLKLPKIKLNNYGT